MTFTQPCTGGRLIVWVWFVGMGTGPGPIWDKVIGTGMGSTYQRVMEMGTGIGLKPRVWVHDFVRGYEYGYG